MGSLNGTPAGAACTCAAAGIAGALEAMAMHGTSCDRHHRHVD